MKPISKLRASTKADYNTLVNWESAVKAMNEGKRVHALSWNQANKFDRLGTVTYGDTVIYVQKHINRKGCHTANTMLSDEQKQTPNWIIVP